jgi:hypothetical protein
MDVHELTDRLYDRCRARLAETDRQDLETLMHEDISVAAIDLVSGAIDDRELEPDEVTAAIDLARNGKFLKSSGWLLERLAEYQKRVMYIA